MTFNIKAANEGISFAIQSLVDAKTQQTKLQASLVMDEIKRKRKEEYETKQRERKEEYVSPMEKAFSRRFFNENPDQISQFSGVPGIGMEAKSAKSDIKQQGTGGPTKTSQGTTAPSTYTPPQAQDKTIKMTAQGGFAPMSPKEQIQQEALEKYRANMASPGEKKMLGITDEENFVDALRQVDSGEKDIKEVEKKYPEKAKRIREYKINKMDFKTKNIMEQIKSSLKSLPDEEESYYDYMESVLTQLIDDKEEAISKGVDVDAIMDVLDINESDWANLKDDKKQQKIDRMLKEGVFIHDQAFEF